MNKTITRYSGTGTLYTVPAGKIAKVIIDSIYLGGDTTNYYLDIATKHYGFQVSNNSFSSEDHNGQDFDLYVDDKLDGTISCSDRNETFFFHREHVLIAGESVRIDAGVSNNLEIIVIEETPQKSISTYSGTGTIYTVPAGKIAQVTLRSIIQSSGNELKFGDISKRGNIVNLNQGVATGYFTDAAVNSTILSKGTFLLKDGSASVYMLQRYYTLIAGETVEFLNTDASDDLSILVIEEDI